MKSAAAREANRYGARRRKNLLPAATKETTFCPPTTCGTVPTSVQFAEVNESETCSLKPELANQDKLTELPVRTTAKAGTPDAVVVNTSELLPVFGSVWFAATDTVLVNTLTACGRVTTVSVAVPPLGRVPTAHVS